MKLPALPDGFDATRDEMHRIAVHVVARARRQATGRFGLRVTSGGFGTPTFGDDVERVRTSRGLLVHEAAPAGSARTRSTAIDGASLAQLAHFVGVDLDAELDVGHDTPPMGDLDRPVSIDVAAVRALSGWYTVIGSALDAVAAVRPDSTPTAIQLWPEHFDLALDAAFDPAATDERRVNLGGSPGDGFSSEPYLYVGPWTGDRPGDDDFWNAPFGATLGYATVMATDDPVVAAAEFFLRGHALLYETR